ncbi:hypothetical protein [Pseudanabaena sp. PCC 6802]|uniref:hypothetical protein n=1 Tax=Pseudanabaena sp. PCC 6802 TaxID=118173 RepID=UPI0003462BCA|nr:hypothetical protein [Pseudanabaena sp. PCC 6802]
MARNIQEHAPFASSQTSTLEPSSFTGGRTGEGEYGLEADRLGSGASSNLDSNLTDEVDRGKILGRIGSFLSGIGNFLRGDRPVDNMASIQDSQSQTVSDPVRLAEERATIAFLNNPGNFLGVSASDLSGSDNWLNRSRDDGNNRSGAASAADFLNNPGVMLGDARDLARFNLISSDIGGGTARQSR